MTTVAQVNDRLTKEINDRAAADKYLHQRIDALAQPAPVPSPSRLAAVAKANSVSLTWTAA